ncbi:hypothetical protein [Streptomyces sp. WG-D5]
MRRLRWAMVTGLLTAVLLSSPTATPAALALPPYAAEPSPHGSLAGSRAGVGRTPPGRALPSPTPTGAVVPPAPTEPPPTVPREPRPEESATAPQAIGEPGPKPLVNVLPLGAGLLLTGLGIAFLALRLRR